MYFGGPLMTFRARFSSIVDPLKYTRFYKVREKKLVYFSGSQKWKFFVLYDKNFHFLSPLKHIRFSKVREKKLMYFKGPIWSTKVHKVLRSERKKTCVL